MKCGNDTDTKLVFFNITDMDLQGDDCTNDLTNNNVYVINKVKSKLTHYFLHIMHLTLS